MDEATAEGTTVSALKLGALGAGVSPLWVIHVAPQEHDVCSAERADMKTDAVKCFALTSERKPKADYSSTS